jgi:hypothetical protein
MHYQFKTDMVTINDLMCMFRTVSDGGRKCYGLGLGVWDGLEMSSRTCASEQAMFCKHLPLQGACSAMLMHHKADVFKTPMLRRLVRPLLASVWAATWAAYICIGW